MWTAFRRHFISAALPFAAVQFPAIAQATSLEITPVAVHLVAGQQATTIGVMNRGGAAVAIQLRAFAWSQPGDEDVLTPTNDIILSPPIFTVAKGATQTIRLMVRKQAKLAGQRTYRLMIDEVPPANVGEQQVLIAMRVSVPLVIAAASAKPKALIWHARRSSDDRILLSATNAGTDFDRIYTIGATLADGSHPAVTQSGTNAYVLAGARRQWVLQAGGGKDVRALRLNVTNRGGKSEQILALDP